MTVLLRFTLGARDIVRILKLGVTSFGGPIAHIGYFREEIVVRRRWLDDAAYTDLVALCQFLSSSQARPAVKSGVRSDSFGQLT